MMNKHAKSGERQAPKNGRPSLYTSEVAAAICLLIAAGETTEKACALHGIKRTTFLQWRSDHPELADRYARAMEDRGELLGERLAELAASATPKTVNVVRLQVDTHKFIAARLAPKRYGDRVGVEHSGEVAVNVADRLAQLRAARESQK